MLKKYGPTFFALLRKPWLWGVLIVLAVGVPLLMVVADRTRAEFLQNLDAVAAEKLAINVGYMQSQIENLNNYSHIMSIEQTSALLLKHPHNKTYRDFLNRYLANIRIVAGDISYIMDANGTVLASGNWDATDSFVGSNYGFRPYFKTAMQGFPAQYVDVGITSNKLGFYVAMPVIVDGDVAGAVVTKKDPQKLIMPNVNTRQHFIVTDHAGIVIVSDRSAFLYHSVDVAQDHAGDRQHAPFKGMTIRPLSEKPVESVYKIRLISVTATAPADQNPQPYVIKSANVPHTGFQAHVLVPIDGLNARLQQKMASALVALILSAMIVSLAVERWLLMQQIHARCLRDPLTGLYTRLYMTETIGGWLATHDRGDIGGIGVVMFDLDHFKRINDTYGHLAGDHVLAQVAAVILQECRKSDMPIRFGGEELLIFIPSENMAHIVKFAERIRSIIENRDLSFAGRPLKVTLTGGIATHQRGETLAQFLERADQRLYQAKQNGRNQIATET